MVRSLSTYRIQGCGALIRARWQAPLGPIRCPTTDQLRSTRSKIELDRKRLIQGLLRLHSRYGPPDCSAAQSDLCHEAPAQPVTQQKPLVSFRINRQLSGWNLPPLMIRAFEAHYQKATL